MDKETIIERIQELKKTKNAVILAHLYQNDEIQELADFTGDSLELSRKAAATDADVIVFCGVRFMAETAKILSPNKKVLLVAMNAGCPLADMITPKDVLEMKKKYPQAAVVTYVNSSAEVKAISDYCCTSSNAIGLVRNIPEKEVIFIPDMNLGSYVKKNVPEKIIHLNEGYCPIHHQINEQDVLEIRGKHPNAPVYVHPECKPEVSAQADFVGSTAAILKKVLQSVAKEVIIGTDKGIFYRLKKENPDKNFIPLSPGLYCNDMKMTRLEDVHEVLKSMKNEINLNANIIKSAGMALNRMLKYS